MTTVARFFAFRDRVALPRILGGNFISYGKRVVACLFLGYPKGASGWADKSAERIGVCSRSALTG